MMDTVVARGSCLCGAVRFRASLPCKWVAHCHCTCCRRAHGAPLVTLARRNARRPRLVHGPVGQRTKCSCVLRNPRFLAERRRRPAQEEQPDLSAMELLAVKEAGMRVAAVATGNATHVVLRKT